MQFLNYLGLVKVALYDLMKHHFDYHQYPGINYDLSDEAPVTDKEACSLVRDLDEALRAFQVKLAAAYARIRIERKASGNTPKEQMENVLPDGVREKEDIAGRYTNPSDWTARKCFRGSEEYGPSFEFFCLGCP